MRRGTGDVLAPQALVEFDRGVDAAQDRGRTALEPAAPERVRRIGLDRLHPGHGGPSLRWRRGVMTGWRSLIVAVSLVCAGNAAAQEKLGEFIPADPPQPAPEISVADADGNSVALADLRGKLVLVNLWATWCQPCIKEMPSLAGLPKALGDGF